jgi:hypothetical protein
VRERHLPAHHGRQLSRLTAKQEEG